jgi:hypothetical protein
MNLQETALQSIFDEDEFIQFKDIVRGVGTGYQEIVGVMAIGSMCQRLRLPSPATPPSNSRLATYDIIRNPARRRMFPCIDSDLDLWVCTKDEDKYTSAEKEVSERAITLIDWLVANPEKHLTEEWVKLKQTAFSELYKQDYLYSKSWVLRNGDKPWLAEDFKGKLIGELQSQMPEIVQRVNSSFTKKVEGGFFEVRAFPASVFNLRPEDIVVNGTEDRSPFPRVVNEDWLDINSNVFVLYDSRTQDSIYPFDPNGRKLGGEIWKHVNRD